MAIVALFLIAASAIERRPRLVWNASASLPVGLYVISVGGARLGDTVALHLPRIPARLAAARGYLSHHALLLKPIVAIAGDRVCRWHTRVLVNGHLLAVAAVRDAARRLLPVWQGCRFLERNEMFLLSSRSDSFDSRYFGPIRDTAVIAIARPILNF